MAKYDDMSFGKAFAAARKEKGAGNTFMWKGKSYSTNQKGESGTSSSSAPKTDIAKMASVAIDRSGPTRPRSRPSANTGTRPRSRPEGKAPTATSVSTPEVTTEKLPSGPKGASGTTYGEWKEMSRAERKAAGLPVSSWGGAVQAWRKAGGMSNMSADTRMAKGGMVGKSGYAKGGMVKSNCGASMKPTQKSSKGK